MTEKDFMLELKKRYSTISEYAIEDIRGAIRQLTPQQLGILWSAFIDSYDFSVPPRRATFTKLMIKEGFYKKEQEKKIYIGLCKECRVSFPNNAVACPICGGDYVFIDATKTNVEFIRMQDHCSTCERFKPHNTTGAECGYWGKSQSWGLSGSEYRQQLEICKSCECRVCCREERIFRTSYETYKELTAKGEFADGYIKKKP